jgi:ectoine hydroxylase-related dioxygenase (phytanoyl-CoA dioxygenase family)
MTDGELDMTDPAIPPTPLTEREKALLPSDADVAFYREHGYYVSQPIFSDAELDAAIEAQERFYAGGYPMPMHPALLPRLLTARPTEFTPGAIRKFDYRSYFVPELAVIARKPLLGAIAARLAGTPAVRLWHDQLLYKPPQDPAVGSNVGWHTDRGYWQVATSDNLITAWVPFHACDETIGTITMIDGSHRWPDNTSQLDFFSNDLEGLERRFNTGGDAIRKTPMLLARGQVSFHHCRTIHGSGPNHTQGPRRSIAVHLQDDANRHREFTLANGQPAWHFNNIFARQVDGHPDFTDPTAFPTIFQA